MKLNLGCGKDYIKGFINIDTIKGFKADLYHDLRYPLPYSSETVTYIKAKDIFEHFNKYEAEIVFRGWVNLLCEGGIIEVTVPDIEVIIKNFNGDTLLNLIFGEPLFAGIDTGNFGMHKWGYTKQTLKKLFEDNDLEVLELVNVDGTNIFCKGRKKERRQG